MLASHHAASDRVRCGNRMPLPVPIVVAMAVWLASGCLTGAAEPSQEGPLIGYTELQTNLPGGRHANVRTMRAAVVALDGSGRRLIADELATKPDTSTRFAGWCAANGRNTSADCPSPQR